MRVRTTHIYDAQVCTKFSNKANSAMSSTATRVIKNTGYLYAKMGITMFVSLYTTRLILNGLGASDFGIFNIVGGAIAMLGFLNAAMASATQRFMSYAEGEGNKEKQKYIFNISIVLHAAIVVIVGIALVGAGWFFFNGILTIPEDRVFAAEVVYASLIISTMFTVMSAPYDAVLNAHENMRYYAIVGIIESFLKLGVAFACVYTSSDKLIVYGILMAAIPLVTLSIMRVYCHHHYEECILAPRRYYNKELMKEMTGFAGWNFLGSACSMICNYGQGIVLNHFFGTLLNAAQGIANQLNGQLQVLALNMVKAVTPQIGISAGERNYTKLQTLTIETARISSILFAVIAIPFFVFCPCVLSFWLGEYPEWTVTFVRFQLIYALLEFLKNPLMSAISSVGIIKYVISTNSIVNILSLIIFGSLFMLHYSPIAMCWVMLGVRGIETIVMLFNAQTHCHLPINVYFTKTYCPIFAYVTFCIGVISFIPIHCINSTIAQIIILTIIYTIVTLIACVFLLNKDEKIKIKNILSKLTNLRQ